MSLHADLTSSAHQGLRSDLTADHQRLQRSFEDLLAAFRAGAREDAALLWTKFEASLLAHFAFEEQHILPAFQRSEPVEAAALLAEHHEIRALLNELGVGVDLHLTNAVAVDRLLERLEHHARREDALMYRWADRELGGDPKVRPPSEVGRALRRLVDRSA